MRSHSCAIITLLFTAAVANMAAADNPAAQLTPKRFTAELDVSSAVAYRQATRFTDPPKVPGMSKRTKIAVVVAVAGAAVAGIFLAKGALKGGSSTGGGTPLAPGQTGSTVIINGVPQ